MEVGCITPTHFMIAQPSSGPRSRQGGPHDTHLHLRPPRTQAHSHRIPTRCVTITGTREYCSMCGAYGHSSHLARDLARPTSYQSRPVGRLGAIESGGSRQAGEVEDVSNATRPSLRAGFGADVSSKSTTQARGTGWVALSNGRGQIARSPTAKEARPYGLSYLSDLASSYPARLPLDCCAVSSSRGSKREVDKNADAGFTSRLALREGKPLAASQRQKTNRTISSLLSFSRHSRYFPCFQ